MKLKKELLTMLIIAASLLLIPIVLLCFAFGLPTQYDLSFYGGMKIKTDRLKSVEGKKIVIIGGSSVAFGVRSDIMEQELGMSVVNFGLYANLGTKYMLDVAKSSINEGDIVVIAPEQNEQSLSTYFNGEAVWYSADGNFGLLNKVAWSDKDELFNSFLTFVSGKFGYWQSGEKPCPDGVYNVHSFNEYGDICYERGYNVMSDGYDVGTPISFNPEVISDDFIDYINKYSAKLVKNGATVYFAYGPMNGLAVSDDEEAISDYNKMLAKNLNCEILGGPETRIMDSAWFYDSNFHLNDSGAVVYTRQLVQDIKARLGDFTPVNVELPEKPEKPDDDNNNNATGTVSKDLTEAAKVFLLSGVEITTKDGEVVFSGSWTVDGLTDYGKTLFEITIPDTIAGLPVTTVAAQAFAGNATVQKITLGVNINSVGTNAFYNCSALGGIYITSLDPNSFHPAVGLLSGADSCVIFVPQESYASDYLTDYFWGAFTGRLKGY